MSSIELPLPSSRALSDLARATGLVLHGDDIVVTGVSADSREVERGDLFVAVPGIQVDGVDFIADALAAGAIAVCASHPVPGVPTLIAEDPRPALADLAAEFFRHPAREVALVGITGSLGKTSTALLTQACLAGGGVRVGVIGSLGVRARGAVHDTGMTTPDALTMQQQLRWMADEGVGFAVMEVSSHGILLDRVRGLELAIGVFTNLVPDEHLEFHPTPEHYVQTKLRFLHLLRAGAPLIYNADDERVRAAAASRTAGPAIGVSMAGHPEAAVHVRDTRPHTGGSDFVLDIRRRLETAGGAEIPASAHSLRVPLLGPQQVENAAMSAIVAMVAGVPPDDVRDGLARLAPIRRRMEIVHPAAPMVVDDTVGNPRSIEQVRRTVRALAFRSVRIAYVIRGLRGPVINAHNAEALTALVNDTGASLVVSASTDHADERNTVTDEEREATLDVLREAGIAFSYVPRLADAIHDALDRAGAGDLVLLLGAQGMDAGAEIARGLLAARDAARPARDPVRPAPEVRRPGDDDGLRGAAALAG